MATTQSLSKPEANDLVGFRGRIESLSARSLRELSDTASVRDDAGNAHIRKTLIILLSAFFTIGLLLGWIVIGWWLWPVEWSTFTPQDTASDYQQMLVTWGANKYWDTGDATQVRKAFGAWDRDDLAKLLSGMQRNTKDTEMRRRLVALTQALDLPVSDSSLFGFVAQPGIVVGILLSAAPLLGALGFVTLPRLRRKRAAELEEMVIGQVVPAEESLDELLADVDVNDPAAVVVPGEEKEEEKEDEKPSDEEAEGQSSGLGDLASLFEEEETSISALEAFCKGMPEISVEELITMGANILQRMRQSKPEDRRN